MYLKEYPYPRNLQMIFHKERQLVDFNLVVDDHYRLHNEAAMLQVVDFYLISFDEIAVVAVISISFFLYLIERHRAIYRLMFKNQIMNKVVLILIQRNLLMLAKEQVHHLYLFVCLRYTSQLLMILSLSKFNLGIRHYLILVKFAIATFLVSLGIFRLLRRKEVNKLETRELGIQ